MEPEWYLPTTSHIPFRDFDTKIENKFTPSWISDVPFPVYFLYILLCSCDTESWLIKVSSFVQILLQGWKALYINQHRRMNVAISNVVEFVGSSLNNGWLESECYLKAIADLALTADIGFLDVQFFLFSRNHSAIINLIGLHFSIASLHVPVSKALLVILLYFSYG